MFGIFSDTFRTATRTGSFEDRVRDTRRLPRADEDARAGDRQRRRRMFGLGGWR